MLETSLVIPAQAGIQLRGSRMRTGLKSWIPACAGMTNKVQANHKGAHQRSEVVLVAHVSRKMEKRKG
ncbi:MAG TPA: hypothetical protein EYH41_07510 [Novosphingobium capsulatum]|nr:hypothetical protein [Novosphingobium capsulatum]